MRWIGLCLILGLICCVQYSESAKKNRFPFGRKPIPAKTPSPININTRRVKSIATRPLTIFISLTDKVRLYNTGRSVEVILTSPKTTCFVYGGVLKSVYIFSRQKFFFSNKTNGVAGTTVNKKEGEPLEACLYYYNWKYGSFENALNFRDGLFELRSRIQVKGNVPNLVFDTFVPYLKQVLEAPSSVEMPIIPTFAFYNIFPIDVEYYAYPGSYVNETTGKEYYCTTTIIKPVLPYRLISELQYAETWGAMKDLDGNSLNTAQPQSPSGGRPIVKTVGLIEALVLPEVIPVKPGGI